MEGLSARGVAHPPILMPASLRLSPGSIVGLIGPNGSGKTTLLRRLIGLIDGPGDVVWDGDPLQQLSMRERARRIAYMPAERTVDWPMTVRDVVMLGRLPHGDQNDAAVTRALAATESLAFAARPISHLSTGERARVLLARALAGEPRYLLLDEPVANLDPHYQLAIIETLHREAARGVGVLMVLHDLALAERHCHTLLLLHEGRLVASGAPASVLTPEHLAGAFRVARTSDGWQRT